jgi:uncharacterized Zn finger protein
MTSKCVKCSGINFEFVRNTPSGSRFNLMFVQCAACGSVVGAMEADNVAQQLINLSAVVKRMADRMQVDSGEL